MSQGELFGDSRLFWEGASIKHDSPKETWEVTLQFHRPGRRWYARFRQPGQEFSQIFCSSQNGRQALLEKIEHQLWRFPRGVTLELRT